MASEATAEELKAGKMSKEKTAGTSPAGQENPVGKFLKKPMTRRALLGGGLAAGTGLAALAAANKLDRAAEFVGLSSGEQAGVSEKSVVSLLRFEELRQKVDQMPGPKAEKQRAYDLIDKFIRAEKSINEFKAAQGVDQLVAYERAALRDMDITPLWRARYNSEADYLKARLFFMEDDKAINLFFPKPPKGASVGDFTKTLESFNRTFFEENWSFYLEVGTRRQERTLPAPAAEFDFSQYKYSPSVAAESEIRAIVEEDWSKSQNVGQIKVRIVNGYVGSFSGNTVVLGDRTIYPEGRTAAHEFHHAHDPTSAYRRLAPYFTAQELVNLLVLREKIVADPAIGRKYPEIARIFAAPDFPPDTPVESIWFTTQGYMGEIPGLKVFDETLLPTGYVENITRLKQDEADKKSRELGIMTRSGRLVVLEDHEKYGSYSRFLATDEAELDNLAKSDKRWAYIVSRMRQKSQYLDNSRWFTDVRGWFSPGDAPSYWRSLPKVAQGLLAEGAFENDPQFRALFDEPTYAKVAWELYDFERWLDGEKFAEILERKSDSPLVRQFNSMLHEELV